MPAEASLSGKTAIVTGAGRGIGRSIAVGFSRAGANLGIFARTEEELSRVAKEIEANGSQCYMGLADLADPVATRRACDMASAELGEINVLVNNAGVEMERAKIAESDPERWWRTVEINVRSAYLVTRFLLDNFADGGKIINISSGFGLRAADWNSAYTVSKAGLHIFTECLANELWPRKIDVNNLIPGPVATDMFNRDEEKGQSSPEEILAKFEKELPSSFPPQERIKHPDDVADLALYMATRPVGGPTGQTFSLGRRPF